MTIEQRELDFRAKVNLMTDFPFPLRKEFIEYWSEPNKSRTKMRWELEKTWDLRRRLLRWERTSKENRSFAQNEEKPVIPVSKEIAELDAVLSKYRLHPTEVSFISLANYYPYMKENKLIKKFTKDEVEDIKRMFNSDQVKCRAYCVEQTLRGYVDSSITFSDIMGTKLRAV